MNNRFFDIAFDEAKKAFDDNEVPVGAVVVKDDKVLGKGYNKKEKKRCSLYHAEVEAIYEASKNIGNWRLEDCDIYVTLSPCPMCASLIKQSRIRNVYSGIVSSDPNNELIINKIFDKDSSNPKVNYFINLDVDRNRKILNDFFQKRRNKE